MNKRAYELANEISTELPAENGWKGENLGEGEIDRYKKAVLEGIRKEEEGNENISNIKKSGRRISWLAVKVACAAVLFLGVTVFSGEVHAVIEHISWSIGNALGLSGDLEEYRDVVGVPVADKGYVITLQEVVAAEEKLVVNYTLQREDGEPMELDECPFGGLFVNGKEVEGGSSGSGQFLNEEQTIVGIAMSYDMPGVDMSQENIYQLKFNEIGAENGVKGKWNFQFTARGADLIEDTRRIPIQKEFVIGDNVTVTLKELTINELEQRISYQAEGAPSYMLMLMAEDDTGNRAQFDTKTYTSSSGKGYMQNQEVLYDGRIDGSASIVRMTLYAVEIPKESGKLKDDYQQIGDPFEVELN